MSFFNFLKTLFVILGSLSILLYGLNILKSNLSLLLSTKFKDKLLLLTTNKYVSFFLGIIFTVLIQSSSSITAIVVVLLSSKLISFKSALSIILGSNIGTTITTFLFTIDFKSLFYLFIFLGFVIISIKKNNKELLGNAILSIGLIFLGIDLLETNLINIFINSFKVLNNSNIILNFLYGSLVSGLTQSSSATIAVIEILYSKNLISLIVSVSLMLGANLGTTLSGIIPTISFSKDSKLIVLFNIITNLVMGIIFIILINPFCNLLLYIENNFITNKEITIALSHLLFNIFSSLILFLFLEKILLVFDKYQRL